MKKMIFVMTFAAFVASPLFATVLPTVTYAESPNSACEKSLLGLGIPPWYRGVAAGDDCHIISPDDVGGLSAFVWKIVLNVVNMLLVIIAYITVGFIIYGGFLYMTGGSVPGQLEKAKKSIINAVIGFVISIASVGILNLIFGIIK